MLFAEGLAIFCRQCEYRRTAYSRPGRERNALALLSVRISTTVARHFQIQLVGQLRPGFWSLPWGIVDQAGGLWCWY